MIPRQGKLVSFHDWSILWPNSWTHTTGITIGNYPRVFEHDLGVVLDDRDDLKRVKVLTQYGIGWVRREYVNVLVS